VGPLQSGDHPRMSVPLAKRLSWGLVTLCLVVLGCGLALYAAGDAGLNTSRVFTIALTATLLPVGVLVTRHQPANPIGWMFLLVALTVALGALAAGYAHYWTSGAGGSEGLGEAAAWYANSSWTPWVLIPATFLLLLFPDGRLLPGRRWRIVAWCAGLGIALTWLGSLLSPGKLEDYPRVQNPYGVGLADPLQGIGFLLVAIALAGSVAAVVLRSRRGDREQREQIKWIALAAAVIAVILPSGIAVYDVVGAHVANVAIEFSILGLPVAAAVAILRYRLYDIDIVINRTLVYATLTAGLAAVYAAIALGLGVAIGSGSTVPTAAATLAVALLFRPLRTRVQKAVDRRFDRARYEGLQTVERFLAELRAGRAAPEKTGAVLAEALGDPDLELLFWLPEEEIHVNATGRAVGLPDASGRARTPVRRGDLQLATVIHDEALARRPNLLEAVLAAAGLAIEVGRLRAEVRRRLADVEDSRARIVIAGYEERRHLERDLHDGAQQRLVSIGLALRHVQGQLPGASREAAELDAAVAELTDAIEELRELARGVRPAGLDDGLAAALRALAARSPLRTTVEATNERFDDRLETAAYFVVSEALTNTIKHAHASRVTVTAAQRNGTLVVSVRDDGAGGAGSSGGSGLVGMSDRVAALGGRLRVESEPAAGTLVTAELPCA
jgi:signal transduction histidine kinase